MGKNRKNGIVRQMILLLLISASLYVFFGCKKEDNNTSPSLTETESQPLQASDEGSDEEHIKSSDEGSGDELSKSSEEDIDNNFITYSTDILYQNDFILYYVNCASENVTEVLDGDYLGLYQSIADQEYGTDNGTGTAWGYQKSNDMAAEGDRTSIDKKDSKWIIAEGIEYDSLTTGFYYDFSLPEGNYEIVAGFYNPFSARTVDVVSEGETKVSELKLLKFKLAEAVFKQEVTDGMLNLKIYNPKREQDAMKNPILSYIIIRAVPDYTKELLSYLLTDVEDILEKESNYTRSSYEAFIKKEEEARNVFLSEDSKGSEIESAYLALKEAFEILVEIDVYDSFRPGEIWCDTDGTLIQAHGGQVQKLMLPNESTGELEEIWWWVGEDKTKGYRGGICAYSSKDLYNWTFEGVVMRNISERGQLDTEEYFVNLYQGYSKEELDNVYNCINDTTSVIERPKMIYNEASKQYVIWFHADGPTEESTANYAAASAGVAVSDSPNGPFRFIDRYRLNTCPEDQEDMYPESKGMARDMNLFVDDDGTAYIIYSSEENLTMYISRLNEEYTFLDTEPEKAVVGVDFVRLFPGAQREAPAVIKKDGKYYMITSGATGWSPNQARYYVADSIFGNWVDMGDPCIDDTKRTTFDSQSTCIFESDGQYIYMGDRWNSDDLKNSRYVWLPVEFDEAGYMSVIWQEEWR